MSKLNQITVRIRSNSPSQRKGALAGVWHNDTHSVIGMVQETDERREYGNKICAYAIPQPCNQPCQQKFVSKPNKYR